MGLFNREKIITDLSELTEEEKGVLQKQFIDRYRFRMYRRTIASLLLSLGMFAGTLIIIFGFCLDVKKMYGTGMQPTIKEDSIVFINRLAYRERLPLRGDVVVSDGRIGRVVGLPGEHIKLYGGHVYINGKFADEEYLTASVLTYPYHGKDEFELDGRSYFLLTDDRYSYDDSRDGSVATLDTITGRIIAGIKI